MNISKNYRIIGPEHESAVEQFLMSRIGDGYYGIRIEHGVIVLKVLPVNEKVVTEILSNGHFLYEIVPASKKTGVSSIAVIGHNPPRNFRRGHHPLFRSLNRVHT